MPPEGDGARIAEVRRYGMLNGAADGAFGRIVGLAARLFDAPIAAVGIVEADHVRLFGRHGLDPERVPHGAGLWADTIGQDEPHIIDDARLDPRSSGNPLVQGEPGVRFYAGAALRSRNGHAFGALAVMDRRPRVTTAAERELLATLAQMAMDEMELREEVWRAARSTDDVVHHGREFAEALPQMVWTAAPDGRVDFISEAFYRHVGRTGVDLAADGWLEMVHPQDRARSLAAWRTAITDGRRYAAEFRLWRAADATYRWHLDAGAPVRDGMGRITKWYGTLVDVHERVEAESALRAHNVELQRRTAALMEVTRAATLQSNNLDAALRLITEAVARTLAVARAGIWMLNDTQDGIICLALFDASARRHEAGAEVAAVSCPAYFQALRENDVIAADDALTDPRTTELAESYLRPLRIGAMLDTPILTGSALAGVLCLEHVGSTRGWTQADRGFALAVANLIGLVVSQAARAKAQRLRMAETEIFDLISAGAALPEVLDRIARAMEQTLGSARVAIFLVDPDGLRFRHGAAPQLGDYTAKIDGVPIGAEVGTCGAAIVARRQVISADLESDPLWKDLLPLAREHRLRACWSTPALDIDGKPLATFAVYCDHPRAPTAEELDVVDRAARLVAVAIQRVRSIEALRTSEATFREAFRDAAIGIVMAAPEGPIIEANAAFARILGYTQEELRGVDLRTLTHPDDLPLNVTLREELLSGRRDSYVIEKRYRSKMGDSVWVRNSVAMRRDAAGRPRNAIIVTEDITRQKMAEEELRQSQALLQVASRMGQLGGWQVRLPDRRMIWSEQVSAIHGLPPGANVTFDEAIASYVPECRPAIRDAFERCVAEGTAWDLELEMITAQGGRVWVRSIGEPALDEAGRIVAVQGALQDISERRRAEALLRESESRFQAIASVTADVVWDWDLRTNRVWWSDDFESAFGWPLAELEPDASSWINRVHPEDRERVVDDIHRVIEARGSSWSGEYRFQHKSGAMIEIDDRGMLILGPDGAPARFVGGMRDITERKRFERDLRERIKELSCLYHVLELITAETRPTGAIAADITALLPSSLLHEEHAVARIAVEEHEHRSAGWQEPVHVLRAPIHAEGKVVGRVEIGYRVALPDQPGGYGPFLGEERALIDAVATHLGGMIHARRMGETLRQSDRLRAVGELTGGIAHDFNNLLTVILGNAELLTEHLEQDPYASELAVMSQAAAESAAELTKRLLAFSRRQALEPRATDLNRLLRDMKGLLRRTLGGHIEIRIIEREALWRALIDPPQLESAILNLCINARDAMPGGGTLTIEVGNVELDSSYAARHAELEPGPYVMVAVSDTGTGMPPEVIERVFDPFFTTKGVGKGSGLGLSMVWGFVKQSKGHVVIYSEPGLGTTVKLLLPRAAADAPSDALRRRAEALPQGSERILIVEDDALVRTHVTSQLSRLGYQVVSAGDGHAALAALGRDGAFDLLFTDIVIPGGMSGTQLAEEARRRYPALRVLFTSGYTEEAISHQGLLGTGVRLLAKPYHRQELAQRVRDTLDGAV